MKTTGGKGLHVVAPLVPGAAWDTSFAFTRRIAHELAADSPREYIATMSKAARGGRIFIDYLRNNRTNTSVAAYSIRARPGAPVSLPVDWTELDSLLPEAFTWSAVLERAREIRKDPWRDYWEARQTLPDGAAGV